MSETVDTSLGRIVMASDVPPGFALFWTTRDFEGRLNREIATSITKLIQERFGIESSLTTCNQVHGSTAARAGRENGWRECDSCDALWSDARGSALGIKVADCLPVTMIDPISEVVANIHSGWRGAAQAITSRSIDAIETATKFEAGSARAWLGPSIRVCCFEVGEEVATQFDPRYVDRTHGPKAHVDLVALTTDILQARGFPSEQIFDSGFCTRCEGSMFHSFRRDGGKGGRNLAIVAL